MKFEYSNLGFGLLGQGLARRAGTDYEKLVETRICVPLGMKSTRITLSEPLRQRLAAGHSADLVTVSGWDVPTLAGAGALRSSANDLLVFLAAMMGYTDTPLAPAMKATLAIKRPSGGQLFVQATNQPRAAVYAKSSTGFFYKVVDAQLTFETDTEGKAAALVLHQGGRDQRAKRIDDAEAKQLEDSVAKRFKDQTAMPGTEAAVRRHIDELQRREPNYDELTPELAALARPQAPTVEAMIGTGITGRAANTS